MDEIKLNLIPRPYKVFYYISDLRVSLVLSWKPHILSSEAFSFVTLLWASKEK